MIAELLDDDSHFEAAKLTLHPGEQVNGTVPTDRCKTFICLRGAGLSNVLSFPKTLLQGNRRALKPGVSIEVPPGGRFELENNADHRLILLDVVLYV